MKEVICYRADSGRLYDSMEQAIQDDSIVRISHAIGVPYDTAKKVHTHHKNIAGIMKEELDTIDRANGKEFDPQDQAG